MSAVSTDIASSRSASALPVRTAWGVAWRGALAGLILQFSIVAAFLLLGLIQAGLPGHMARRLEDAGPYAAVAALLLCCTLGGALWAWLLARIAGVAANRRLAWAAGITYAVAVVAAIFLLNAAEVYFVEGAGRWSAPVYVVFLVSFTLAAAAVAALVGLALGLALGDRRLARNLALLGGGAAGATFCIATLVQDLLGRRVGGPNAVATFTMITVMLLGNLLASITASGVMGVTLQRWLRTPVAHDEITP